MVCTCTGRIDHVFSDQQAISLEIFEVLNTDLGNWKEDGVRFLILGGLMRSGRAGGCE